MHKKQGMNAHLFVHFVVPKKNMFQQYNLNTLVLIAFTRFYFRVFADGTGIIMR